MKKLIINTDGGARNNPGPAGIGVVFSNEEGEVVLKFGEYLGDATNNIAEYTALVRALEKAREFEAEEIICRLDSELVVKQLNGQYKVKDPNLKILYNQIKDLTFMKPVSFVHVYRAQNKLADQLVNQAIDKALLKN